MSYRTTCKSLNEEQKSYDKNIRNAKIAFLLVSSSFVLSPVITAPQYHEYYDYIAPIIGFLFLAGIVGIIYYFIEARRHNLTSDEQLLLNIGEAVESLDSYLEGNLRVQKYLSEAEHRIKKVYSLFRNHDYFSTMLIDIVLKKYFGNQIYLLMYNCHSWLIPAINSGNVDKIKQVRTILDQMATFVFDPKSDIRIEDINAQFKTIVEPVQRETIGEYWSKIGSNNRKLIAITIAIPSLIAILGASLNVNINYIFGATVACFSGLLILTINNLLKNKSG